MIDASVPRYRSLVPAGAAANVLALGTGTLATFGTAKVLGADGRGEIALLTVGASYLVVALGLSLESGVLHFGTRSGGSPVRLRPLLALLGALSLVCAALLMGVALRIGIQWWLAGLFGIGYATSLVAAPLTGVQRLRGHHHSALWWPAGILAAQQLSGLAALAVDKSVAAYLLGSALATAVFSCSLVVAVASRQTDGGGHTPSELRRVVRYSVAGHHGVLLHLLCMRAPLFMVGLALGSQAAGVFSIAMSISEIGLLVSQSQLGWTLAVSARSPSDFDPLRRQLKLCALASAGILSGLVGASVFIPMVLGPSFDSAAVLVAISAPGVVCLGLWRLASYDLASRGYGNLRTRSAAIGTAVVIVGGALAVPLHDVRAFAAVGSITYAVMFFTLMARVREL